jgi:branched-chain amino acid transport system substrate-binding protein
MRITKRELLIGFTALGAGSVLGSSLPGCAAIGSGDDTIRIGALFAVTGFNSPLGTPEKETAQMLEEQINAKGGVKGKKIKVIVYDTESDETKAVTLAKKLITEDKVLAIIGPSSTGESLAVVPSVEQAQVPLLSCAASATITTPIKQWVFKTPQSDALAVSELFDYYKSKKIVKIATLTSTGGFGVTGKAAIDQACPAGGITNVSAETFADKDTDMTVQLTKIKGTDAQAVLVWGTNPGPAIIAKNMKQLGMTIPLFQSHGIANKAFLDLAGDAANGVVFPAGKLLIASGLPDSDPQKKVLMAYATDFQAKYNKSADTFGGHAYDAITLLVAAIEKVGPDKAKVRDELEKITGFVGIGGTFNMSATDHNGLGKGAFAMIRVISGKWEPEKS